MRRFAVICKFGISKGFRRFPGIVWNFLLLNVTYWSLLEFTVIYMILREYTGLIIFGATPLLAAAELVVFFACVSGSRKRRASKMTFKEINFLTVFDGVRRVLTGFDGFRRVSTVLDVFP